MSDNKEAKDQLGQCRKTIGQSRLQIRPSLDSKMLSKARMEAFIYIHPHPDQTAADCLDTLDNLANWDGQSIDDGHLRMRASY